MRKFVQPPPFALPHGQSHFIDPFVKRSASGIVVQLELQADLICPGSTVDVPGLIDSVRCAIKDQRIVAILRGIDELIVPLHVVPTRRPVRTRDSVEDPSLAVAIPGRPVPVSEVALAADHKFVARQNYVEIELRGPEVGLDSGVVVDPEVPQKMGRVSGARNDVLEQHVAPGRPTGVHLKTAAAQRGLALVERHRVVVGVVGARRAIAADAPVRGNVLHLG